MHVVVASHQPLPAKGYGGPQRVIVALVRGLAALGHRITLLAPPTTRVPEATVVAVPPRKLADPATLARYVPRDAAIVHTHFQLRSAPGSFPFVQTVHRNLKPGAPAYPNSIFLSRDHARRHNSNVFVYNGLDPADYVFRRFPRRPSQYDLFLGALHSAKGYHWAVEAAKRSGHRLIVAGGWRPSFTGSIKFVGEVDGTTKAALLARARCLWNPAAWDEPFGLVTIEALLSGTPVLGTRRGALPELITPEVGAAARKANARRPGLTAMHVVVASHYRLPVKGYGGTERVVVALVSGLAALGHRVTLLAAPGTHLRDATVVEVPPSRIRDPLLDLATLLPPGADILHAVFPVRRAPSHPFVQTLEGNLQPGSAVPPNNICVSRNHAQRHGGSDVFVYNGLDPADFVFRPTKADYDLFLGRLHSIKGYRWALAGAKRSGRRLLVGGGWRPSFRRNIRFVGEVDGTKKAELLAGARCLWMPALWEEPFGLTLIEALFSGTPVLATRRGALPEVITPEVGALCDTLDEMIAAAETIHTRDPHACRARAERYFTHLAMAEEYVRMYRALLDTGNLPPGRPTAG